MRLKDKNIIITGAAQGIGAATARLFAAEGAKIALIDRQEDGIASLCAELNEKSAGNHYYALDITDKVKLQDTVKKISGDFSKIDVLINNAGVTRDSMTHKMTDENWELVMDINLKAPFMIVREVFPYMKEQNSGVILNASSVSSLGNIGQANYAASKAGIIAMTHTWALEFARYNIRVNAVAPGFTDTTMVNTIPDEIKEKIIAKVPLRRFASPEEIASAYLFLASDEASFITGQTIFVDGGLTCGL